MDSHKQSQWLTSSMPNAVTAMNVIVFDGSDDDDIAWCDPQCDARLYERKDGSRICSYCGREYLPDSVNKHKRKLSPDKNRYETDGPELISLSGYAEPQKKKKQTVLDKEDKLWLAQGKGRSIIDSEDFYPE